MVSTQMSRWHGGKGHVQRPQTKAEREQYERQWDEIFGKQELKNGKGKKAKSKGTGSASSSIPKG